MPLKGIVFFGLFVFCAAGALFLPHIGVYGYIADYCINPAGQWWEEPFSGLGIRYSLTLALATALGIVFQSNKLKFGEKVVYGQEMLLLMFLGVVWMSVFLSPDTVGHYTKVDHPSVKFTKIVIFAFMMTHVITDRSKLNGLFWVFVIAALLLGMKAWSMPLSSFQRGRLEGIGGADFAEANFFAAFMAAMLPIIGIQFLRSRWKGKLLCFFSGAFTANAVILCRSRGAFLALAVGVLAAGFFAPQRHRKKIVAALILGILGGIYLTDEMFLERISTITLEQEEMDSSSQSRLRLWGAGMKMLMDHPMGIGSGNWYQTIGNYIPEYQGKDSHNTYVKCAAELGIFGIAVYGLILLNAYLQLRRIRKLAEELPKDKGDDLIQASFGLMVSLAIILAGGMTITMIYTEIIWLLLVLPVCLQRAYDNALAEETIEEPVYNEKTDSLVPVEKRT